jgi:protein-tyrosine phosphatase
MNFFRKRSPAETPITTVWPQAIEQPAAQAPAEILVVCTGNICRSPMVAGVLQQHVDAAGLAEKVLISSAGTYGLDGHAASAPGVELLAGRGIDIRGHAARPITEAAVQNASIILVMEEAHRRAILAHDAAQAHKIVLFSELTGRTGDMADPYLRGKRAYAKTLATIDATLESGWDELLRRLEV